VTSRFLVPRADCMMLAAIGILDLMVEVETLVKSDLSLPRSAQKKHFFFLTDRRKQCRNLEIKKMHEGKKISQTRSHLTTPKLLKNCKVVMVGVCLAKYQAKPVANHWRAKLGFAREMSET
jgi:hypothetical protein